MPDFMIQIERLTEAPESFRFEGDAGWWLEREPDDRRESGVIERPFGFDLVASRTEDEVLIQGEVEGLVGLECSRCGKRYSHRLRDVYRLVLEPASLEESADPEDQRSLLENGMSLGEDLEAGRYRGPHVQLSEYFGEVIALAMPIQPLCQEDCLGICTHCGAERKADPREGCRCEDEKIESPFAVLAKLKETISDLKED